MGCSYPSLPRVADVAISEQEIDKSLVELRALEAFLTSARDQPHYVSKPFDHNGLGVLSWRGLLIDHRLIDSFRQQNSAIVRKANLHALVPSHVHLSQHDFFRNCMAEISAQAKDCIIMFSVYFARQIFIHQRLLQLANRYSLLSLRWHSICVCIDCLNLQTHTLPNIWGSEQPFSPTMDSAALEYSEDVPMIKDPELAQALCFDNQNMFVEDPEMEHTQFVRRTKWDPHELAIFHEQFLVHSKDFRKIAEALPLRSTSDVAELYYLRRFSPEMMKIISIPRKRHKKYIAFSSIVPTQTSHTDERTK
jgi:hypothetical protein